MKPIFTSDYEAGLAEGALQERERLRQVALLFLNSGTRNYGRQATLQIMSRLFGPRWRE